MCPKLASWQTRLARPLFSLLHLEASAPAPLLDQALPAPWHLGTGDESTQSSGVQVVGCGRSPGADAAERSL